MLKKLFVVISLSLLAGQARSETPPKLPPRMATYQFVVLRAVPDKKVPPGEAEQLQRAHLEFLVKLNRDRTNLLFGPFLDNTDLRGIVVLDVPDTAAARRTLADDPYQKGGYLTMEVKPWLCETNHFFLPDSPQTPEKFVLGFLKRGPTRGQPGEEAEKIQAGHLAYMGELGKQGKLVIAGPFLDDSDWRGLVIYRVETVAEAKELAAGDPAVKAGRLVIDAQPWMTFKGMLK